MRWLLAVALVAGCGDNTTRIPVTVVHVNATATCGDQTCYPMYVDDMCGYDMPLVTPDIHAMQVYTEYDAAKLAGAVQLQYTGLAAPYEDAHVDNTLTYDEKRDVYGIFDYDYDPLYRVDANGHVTDIDTTKLVAADGTTLHFEYANGTVAEDHVFDAPRIVAVEPVTPPACCSAGRPQELGVVVAALLLGARRRRRRS